MQNDPFTTLFLELQDRVLWLERVGLNVRPKQSSREPRDQCRHNGWPYKEGTLGRGRRLYGSLHVQDSCDWQLGLIRRFPQLYDRVALHVAQEQATNLYRSLTSYPGEHTTVASRNTGHSTLYKIHLLKKATQLYVHKV
eukprot:599938-Rhodomonas_salina.1